MAIALDQSTTQQDLSNQGATSSYSFGTLPAVGSLVIVLIDAWFTTGYDVTSIDDNQGNGTYTILKNASAINGARGIIAYKENVASSGTFTITITHTGATGNYLNTRALSFTGVATSSPLDVSATNSGQTTATDANVTSAATVNGNALVVAQCSVAIAASTNVSLGANATTGYTNDLIYQDFAAICAGSGDHKIVATAGAAQSANWSHDNTDNGVDGWTAVIGVFKEAAAGGQVPYSPWQQRGPVVAQ